MTKVPQIIESTQGENRSPILSLSPKEIQAFYSSITGNKEDLSRYYDLLYQVEISDLENLHHKIIQTSDQYSICAQGLQVKIIFDNDQKESFSSFERFKIVNLSEARCTEAVILKYNFLLKLPGIERTQEYEVVIRVASNIVVMKQIHSDLPSHLWEDPRYKNGYVNVEYVDYAVARSFTSAVHEWFDGLKTYRPGFWQRFAKRHASSLPAATKILFTFLGATYFSVAAEGKLHAVSGNFLAVYLILSLTSIFLLFHIGIIVGVSARDTIRRHIFPSYVHLTKGDQRLIEQLGKDNTFNKIYGMLRIGFSFLAAIICGILANFLYSHLSSGSPG